MIHVWFYLFRKRASNLTRLFRNILRILPYSDLMSISLHIVGQRIVTKRKSMKLSQVELAEKVGISDRTLGKIEKGFDMRLSLMLAIADALDIEPTELLSERIDDELTSLSYVEKQQILSHLKAICQLLPD